MEPLSIVVPAKAGTHYPKGRFGEDWGHSVF